MINKIIQFKNLFKSNKLTTKEIDEILKFNEEFKTGIKISSKDLEKHISTTLRTSKGPRGISKNKLIYLPEDNKKQMFMDLNKKISAEKVFNKYIENDVKNFESDLRIISYDSNNKYHILANPISKGYRLDLIENKNKEIQINNFKEYKIKIVSEKKFNKTKYPNYIELYAKVNNQIRWNFIQFEDTKSEKNFKAYLNSI